ncbi:MAG: trigger factor [Anaerovoracaceae bacterium]|nr:trigger factor [Anaerovoracaceae bacterium]
MKATLISKENNEAKFTMEFTAEEFENAVISVYKVQKDKFSIDGFRKGKAPRSIIEKHYGEGIFFEDAINNLFSLNYPLALDELDLDVIDHPRSEFSQIKKGEGFTVTITVACYPEFEVKDYKGVEIETITNEVTDEDVENELKSRARKNSRMVTVDRPAKDGDTVLIDYEGWSEGVQFPGGTAERQPLKLGSGTFIPGFEDQLIGVNTGESKDVTVTFPEEYHSEDLAGKEAVFKCKVHEIKEEEIPEINDDFVKDISEFDTVDELKADIREGLEKAAVERAETQMKNSVLEKVYEANDIDIPDVMVESEIDNMIAEFDQQLRAQGMDIQTYFQYIGKDAAEFRNEIREDAYKKTKTRMIVTAVAEQEKFEASDEDVDAEIANMAQAYGLEADKIKEMLGAQNIAMIAGDIKVRKAVDFMYDNAVKK